MRIQQKIKRFWLKTPFMQKVRAMFWIVVGSFALMVLFSVWRSEGQLRVVDAAMERYGKVGSFSFFTGPARNMCAGLSFFIHSGPIRR